MPTNTETETETELSYLKSAIDGSATAFMMVDRDLRVTYVNPAAVKLVLDNIEAFRSAIPNVDAHDLVGRSVERLFQDPNQLRGLLTNPVQRAHTTTVKVGKLEFQLGISGTHDANGDSVGSTLVWEDVTERRAKQRASADFATQIDAISKSQAIIEFNLDGTILKANGNFLKVMGYAADEIVGEHHRMFVDPKLWSDPGYIAFWNKLNRGEFDSGEYKRVGKGGREVWIQATYNPVHDEAGDLKKVVKFAVDITEQKLRTADVMGQLDAISKAQAVIEFNLDGTIISANENFLGTMGYTLDEVRGQHHSMFVDEAYRRSNDYAEFWTKVRRGELSAGSFKRYGRHGKEVWIQASYNPILDMNGVPFKIVKYATDVTKQKLKNAEVTGQIEAIQKAQAVIHFDMNGYVLFANDNFLNATGYSLDEIVGKHHRLFVEEEEHRSAAYSEFWAKLNRGEFDAGEYRRVGKGGREVWIQATYNPILDLNGKPYKVVKFASDITDRVRLQEEIRRVVEETIRVAHSLREGDLSETMSGDFTGQFAELQDAFNGFIESMAHTLQQTRNSSVAVGEATVQLRNSSEHLAEGASQQQKACQVSSESLVETAAMVESTATNAGRANELVQQTTEQADQGQEKMEAMTAAMSDISESSCEMSKIIKVIDEIAFQTNLLAVNAAVEAARAGRHGRGFAVVAQEVRSLAGRSAKAAQATSELIEKSSLTVARGVANVEETSAALQEIRSNVIKVRDIVAEITEASAEQSRGLTEVRNSMDEVNMSAASATQQSAELAAAASNLAKQSNVLRDAVGKFKLPQPSVSTRLDSQVFEKIATLLGVEPNALAAMVGAQGATPASATNQAEVNQGGSPTAGFPDDGHATRDRRGFDSF